MQFTSSPRQEIRSKKNKPGGYEWWYFDAIDERNKLRVVIIFYEGNPFSTRLVKLLNTPGKTESALPEHFPAVSISVYKNEKPVYYSFTEFSAPDAEFNTENPGLHIGNHGMAGLISEEKLSYTISLDEVLPSGASIRAKLLFESLVTERPVFNSTPPRDTMHTWNLVQPRSDVSGKINLKMYNEPNELIRFRGTGYHDHNIGFEPLHHEFEDWYWGRFHFINYTLVYYIMNRKNQQQHRAWLISNDSQTIQQVFDDIMLEDKGLSLFGLNPARRITLGSQSAQVTIQQVDLLDNGPFYQRFGSNAFLSIHGEDIPETSEGITEYIFPERIKCRLFWPLVNMRIRHNDEVPHWVQRSKTLYRWTW